MIIKNLKDLFEYGKKYNKHLLDIKFIKKDGLWFIDNNNDNDISPAFCNALYSLGKLTYVCGIDDCFTFKLNRPRFKQDIRFFKELIEIFREKRFGAGIDVKLFLNHYGYEYKVACSDPAYFPMQRVMVISKKDFRTVIPYNTGITDYFKKNALFSHFCIALGQIYFDELIVPVECKVDTYTKCKIINFVDWLKCLTDCERKVIEWSGKR